MLVDWTNRLSQNVGKDLLYLLCNSPEGAVLNFKLKSKETKLNSYIIQTIFVIFVSPFCVSLKVSACSRTMRKHKTPFR
jgi:hypothetical protein